VFSYFYQKARTTPWLGRLALRSIPNVKLRVNVEPVGKVVIRLREHRGYWLRHPLTHERFTLGALQRLIREGDVVYDLGANIGLYSRFMVQCFRAAHVYAFEPMQNNRTLLAENLRIAGCSSRVTVVPRAIGEEDGSVDFQVDDLTSNSGTLDSVAHGQASPSRRQYGLPPATVRVPVSRLDSLIANEGFPVPSVIKVDVEGAEAMVVRGAKQLLSRHGPRLTFELHGADAARDTLQALWSVGYRCFGYFDPEAANTYREILPADLPSITRQYSLRLLVAASTPEEIEQPIQDYVAAA
jgi:FkbM family methyltransferase